MLLDPQGRTWLKGNLHTHTMNSDGKRPYKDVCALYKEHGYDFLAVTDHWFMNEPGEYDGMLILNGIEYDTATTVAEGLFHIVGLCTDSVPDVRKPCTSAQEMINKIHACGGLAVLAHPAWSLNTPAMIQSLCGIDLVEIFNSISDRPFNCRPYSGDILDMLAVAGTILPVAAADDVHFFGPSDTCRSYVMVNADECTPAAIKEALSQGRFYATQGPELYVSLTDGLLSVDCSPVNEIVYYTGGAWNKFRCQRGDGITHGEFVTAPADRFVRVEVRDGDGKCAWSQYIRL